MITWIHLQHSLFHTSNHNKNKYYKAFQEASDYFNKGEITNFIDDMMQLLIEGQNNIIETFENNTEIIKRLAQALDQQGLNKYDSDVLFILLQDKILEVNILELLLKESKISQDIQEIKLMK